MNSKTLNREIASFEMKHGRKPVLIKASSSFVEKILDEHGLPQKNVLLQTYCGICVKIIEAKEEFYILE